MKLDCTFDSRTYVLLNIQEEYLKPIKDGVKEYEFRKEFVSSPAIAFLYVDFPKPTIRLVAEFGTPIIASPATVSKIAEQYRRGAGREMEEYLAGYERAFAIPIESVLQIDPIEIDLLLLYYPTFKLPERYLVLNDMPGLLQFLLHLANQSLK